MSSVAVAVGLVLGCGGATATGPRPSSAFSAADAQLFEDGVDFIADPEALGGGRWGEDWEREMQERIEGSDYIALLSISTLRTDIDPEQHTTYGLVTQIGETLKGKLSNKDLTLVVTGDAGGYASIERDRQRIQTAKFVAFVKWYQKPDGTIGSHFHLSIAAEPIVARVKERTQLDTQATHTIIERSVDNPS